MIIMSATLTGVLSQRLVRKLCSYCKYSIAPSDRHKHLFEGIACAPRDCYQADGCNQCFGTGYKSRIGVFELLVITKEIADCIVHGSSHDEMVAVALRQGTRLLLEDGLSKLDQGLISFDEILRVVSAKKWL